MVQIRFFFFPPIPSCPCSTHWLHGSDNVSSCSVPVEGQSGCVKGARACPGGDSAVRSRPDFGRGRVVTQGQPRENVGENIRSLQFIVHFRTASRQPLQTVSDQASPNNHVLKHNELPVHRNGHE